MASLVGGAALGASFGVAAQLLSDAIKEAVKSVKNFKKDLRRLDSTLDRVKPRIEEVKLLDEKLKDSSKANIASLTQELKEGEQLVRKCGKIGKLNCYRKLRYSSKLLKLEQSLNRFFQLNVELEIWRNSIQIEVYLEQMDGRLDRMDGNLDMVASKLNGAQSKLDVVGNNVIVVGNRLGVKLEEMGSELKDKLDYVANGINSKLNQFRTDGAEVCAIPEPPSHIVGFDVPLRELKRELFREDVKVLGLCALGGCGKTTLAAKLCKDDDVIGFFNTNILFLTISSSPKFELIIHRLFKKICGSAPGFVNDEDAMNHLRELKQFKEQLDPMLLVLDDVWPESEVFLERLRHVFNTGGCKMVVTSRSALQSFDSTYTLKMLSDENSMVLFSHHANLQDKNGNSRKPEKELSSSSGLRLSLLNGMELQMVRSIVRGCKGSPLVLEVIGRSLREQPLMIWQDTERILSSESSSIFESHDQILKCLARSLDVLNYTARQCFLDLGAFPEDHRIPASALIDIWIELHKLHDENGAFRNLHQLSTHSLVNLIEGTRKDAGELHCNLNKLFVVQHDLLRDLAIYKSQPQNQDITQRERLVMERRENDLPEIWKDQKDQRLSARLISILTGERSPSNWCDMQLPEAVVLILDFLAMEYSVPPFLEKMGKLKVLIMTSHGQKPAKLKGGLQALGNVAQLKRIRLEKISIPSLTVPLKNLRKISLVMCEVGQAFSNCTMEISSMLPNLIELNIDYCNDLVELPPGICHVFHLQKLSITNCHNLSKLPEELGYMTNLEALRLHACTGLLQLPESIRNLHELRFLDISECVSMESLSQGLGELNSLEKLDMSSCSRVKELPSSASNLRNLKVIYCDDETTSLWKRLQLPELSIEEPEEDINLSWLGI
ncbi:PREDICTED: putative disease resistance protein At5g47280 isoform X1 [Nelumbo nucifera]|uniref:Disease resistance protein At5g47280 isoform X1 n=2 Tax=Nelumbo nucifera TaxID=4432 RepID=A0A1U7ZM28_NELNU|nr:PREDICTED: putative disease resistance protein At5g47280 isoform X1 [Nelumbo nucifera]DAD40525.1 TPA_asm: hypothetical protein HUJ06_014848 [Nelumbo nucifera]